MSTSETRTRTVSAFEPVSVGHLRLRNRIAMAPMTRSRAFGTTASDDMAEYYAQRAGAGLIITEGIQPSAVGQGYPDTPGLHTPEQVASWRAVTDRVHAEGGVIVAQLMHTGRIGHPITTDVAGDGGLVPVGPSAVKANGQIFTPKGMKDYVVPVALTEADIRVTIADFVDAARNARDAGFDAVEIHGANGYLLHQFLAPNANQRTDRWGGGVDNRTRLTVEVARAVSDAIGAERTGIRISPHNGLGDTVEGDYLDVYPVLIERLASLNLAYLHLVEAGDPGFTPTVRELWDGVLIVNAAGADPMTHPQRTDLVVSGAADLVSFGRLFIANPDLVERLVHGAELALPDLSKAYGGDSAGYTDYPRLVDAASDE